MLPDLRTVATQTGTLPTDYWLTTSADHGATFETEQHLTGPFDMLTAPGAEGLFLGDYRGLVTSGSAFRPFIAATDSRQHGDRTDIFTTAVTR